VHIRVGKKTELQLPRFLELPPSHYAKLLFDLRIRHFELLDGWMLYNQRRDSLAMEGSDLALGTDAAETWHRPLYAGNLDWKRYLTTNNSRDR